MLGIMHSYAVYTVALNLFHMQCDITIQIEFLKAEKS